MKFLHAADIHLDSPLVGLARYEGAPVDLLRNASRQAFTGLIDLALEEAVDFLVIAGDLYDGDWRDYHTGLFFCKQMGRLHEARIPVFLLYGNHDAKSELTKQLRLPRNVREFPSQAPGTFHLEDLNVALHGQSFRNVATLENLAVKYPDALPGWFNIGVLHTALEGHTGHDPYAPCAVAELAAKGYDYWALGHVHEYSVRSERPWIVFPGNLQGRHIRETGVRGAVMVTVDGGRVSVERRAVDVLRWHHLQVDVSQDTQLDAVADRVGRGLEGVVSAESDGRPLAVRVTIGGRSKAHGALFGSEPQLRAEVLAQAHGIAGDRLWIEKVNVATVPAMTSQELAMRSDALADLQSVLAGAAADGDFVSGLSQELKELVTRSPKALFEASTSLRALRDGGIQGVIEEVYPSLLARLASEA